MIVVLNNKPHNFTGLFINIYKTRHYYKNNMLHRFYGCAIKNIFGAQYYYIENNLHRMDGPAAIYSSKLKEWWYHGNLIGKNINKEVFDKEVAKLWLL